MWAKINTFYVIPRLKADDVITTDTEKKIILYSKNVCDES
jgi:hypothetical protein